MRKLQGDTSGFTLVEVIVVLVIIAVLGSVAVPAYTKYLPNIRLKNAAMDLYMNMQKARMGAVKDHTDWAIEFDPAANTYTIYSDSGDGDWSTAGDNVAVETVQLLNYQSGVQYGPGNVPAGNNSVSGEAMPADNVSYSANRVTFDPLGTAKGGYVYLDNQDDTAYAVGTLFTTGRISILKWAGGWE